EANGRGVVRPLTSASTWEKSPWMAQPARDGSILFFEGPTRRTLKRIEADGSGERTVLTGFHGPGFSSLPGGGIVFSRCKNLVCHLWCVDANGENGRQLLALPEGGRGEGLSPDGRLVLFRPSKHLEEMWVVAADGGQPDRIVTDAAATNFPSFSPDGSQVLYLGLEEAKGHS